MYINHQNQIFKKLKLDRNLGKEKLNQIKENYKIAYNRSMSSEHEILFSSISCNENIKINNILEIGTFDGFNAFLLSLLFKSSNIETIDLDIKDDDFKNFYNREKRSEEELTVRKSFLSKSDRINLKQMNSINLINCKKRYDLIWIDGAHGYPMVCMDILNSLKLINDNGLIVCDDVWINSTEQDKMYKSLATYETLSEFKKEGLINFDLIYKRLDANNNCFKKKRKFVAIVSLVHSKN